MVQHGRFRLLGPGNVWQCRQEYPGRTGISELQCVVGEEYDADGKCGPAVKSGSLQPLQSSKLQPAGQLPRLPDVRTYNFSTRSTSSSVWIEAAILATDFAR